MEQQAKRATKHLTRRRTRHRTWASYQANSNGQTASNTPLPPLDTHNNRHKLRRKGKAWPGVRPRAIARQRLQSRRVGGRGAGGGNGRDVCRQQCGKVGDGAALPRLRCWRNFLRGRRVCLRGARCLRRTSAGLRSLALGVSSRALLGPPARITLLRGLCCL